MFTVSIGIDARVYLGIAALATFAFLFNLAYSAQRAMSGALALPAWLILINICLVVTICRDRKGLLIGGLVVAMYVVESMRYHSLYAASFASHIPALVIWTGIVNFPLFLYVTLTLFTRLDLVGATIPELEAKIKKLTDESTHLLTAITAAQRNAAESVAAVGAASGPGGQAPDHEVYRRTFEALVAAGSGEALVAAMARCVKESALAARGLVAEVTGTSTCRVRETWGGRAADALGAGLIALMAGRPLPLSDQDLARARKGCPDLLAFEKQAWEVLTIYPVGDGKRLRALLVIGASGNQEPRSVVIQTVADMAAEVLQKRWAGA